MKALPEDRTIIEPGELEVNALADASNTFFSREPLRVLRFVCLCAVLASVACTDDETKAKRLEADAVVAVEEQRFDDAIELYREIVATYPATETAHEADERITFISGLSHSVTSFPSRTARDLMVKTARAVQRYRWTKGRWPDSLDALRPDLLAESPIDPWGRSLQYERRRNGYRLSCLGADGRVGGDGEATDFLVVNGDFVTDPTDEGPF
jgi:hypothetical protein